MEEFDSHTEHVHDQIQEHAGESRERWVLGVALTAAILAALAAVTSLLAGHQEHEAMIEQIRASDQWGYYQAKGIKAAVLEERIENVQLTGQNVPESQKTKLAEYKKQQQDISAEAKELEAASRGHDHLHMIFAGGVTLFQVAIAVSAVSVLTRRPAFWLVGLALGLAAVGFLGTGLTLWATVK